MVLREPAYRPALRHAVAAAVEHHDVPLGRDFRSVVDVGAGRGQFALVARRRFPQAMLHCFEPLGASREKLVRVMGGARAVQVHAVALGSRAGEVELQATADLDSSSLLALTPLHSEAFDGAQPKARVRVPLARLDQTLSRAALPGPSLLKIDVQGYELDVLEGAKSLLEAFRTILIECSFVELYEGQALADEVTCFLRERGFGLTGVFGLVSDEAGRCLQADFLFEQGRC